MNVYIHINTDAPIIPLNRHSITAKRHPVDRHNRSRNSIRIVCGRPTPVPKSDVLYSGNRPIVTP